MSSLIIQVGRAIYEADPQLRSFDDLTEAQRQGYYNQAQAALRKFQAIIAQEIDNL